MEPVNLSRLPMIAVCAVLIVTADGSDKRRDWKTGTVSEISSLQHSETRTSSGTKPNGMPDGTTDVSQSRWEEKLCSISGTDRVYTFGVSQRNLIEAFTNKPMNLEVGATVKYAVEKDSIYLLIGGKERRFHVTRVALKETP